MYMESNFTKCKVLIVGNRTDKHKQWSLDNDKFGEDDNDKYLGVYFSRNLKSNYHITKHLKTIMDNKINSMIRIVGKHRSSLIH
jgi:hypothetical protein